MVKARLDLFYEPDRRHFFMRTSDHFSEGDVVLLTVDAENRPVEMPVVLVAIDSYGVTVKHNSPHTPRTTAFYPFQSVIRIVKATV